MKIIIVGAGAVGSYLAERFSFDGQDVVVVEKDPHTAEGLNSRLDVFSVSGNGASQGVLKEAIAAIGEPVDLLIAVTDQDGVNALACHSATTLGIKQTVARISDSGLRSGLHNMGVKVVIDPDDATAEELVRLVRLSGLSEHWEFADGRLLLVGAIAQPYSPLLDKPLQELALMNRKREFLIVAVIRNGDTLVARGRTQVQEGDHVLMMVAPRNVRFAAKLLGIKTRLANRVVITGDSRLSRVAIRKLRRAGLSVVFISGDHGFCRTVAEAHPKVLAILDEPADPVTLGALDLGERDALLALSENDADNALVCMLGKALGVPMAVARLHNPHFVGLLEGRGIDAAVSPRLLAASTILRFVRRGVVHSVVTFSDSDAEAIELDIVRGSPVVDVPLREIDLPKGSLVGGIVRGGTPVLPRGDTFIRIGDRIVVFSLPQHISDIENIFHGEER
jgi:trk system potassium uptake protein TrkA